MSRILEIGDDVCHMFSEFGNRRDAVRAGKSVAVKYQVRTVVVGCCVYVLEPRSPSERIGFARAWERAQKLQDQWTEEDSYATSRDEFLTEVTGEDLEREQAAILSHYAYFHGGLGGKPRP